MDAEARPECAVFREAIEALTEAGIPFVIGGAFAVYFYSGAWRNTHDLDFYLEEKYIGAAAEALERRGFRDGGEMAAGDREWIYHALKGDALVDLIWQSPHHLSVVDETYFARSREGQFLGLPVHFLPAEDLLLAKIYTMNQHRCDWPDVLRVVRTCPRTFDWEYVIGAMGENWAVLLSFIILFDWVYPEESCCIPDGIRERLLRMKLDSGPEKTSADRELILDPWIYTRPSSGAP